MVQQEANFYPGIVTVMRLSDRLVPACRCRKVEVVEQGGCSGGLRRCASRVERFHRRCTSRSRIVHGATSEGSQPLVDHSLDVSPCGISLGAEPVEMQL